MCSSICVYVYTLCCHVVLLCMLLLLSLLFVYESCCSSCFKHSLWLILTIMANQYSRYEYILYIYIMLPQWPPVCHEFAMKTQPCFFKRIRRLCRRLLPTYDFGSVLRHINRRVRESEGEIHLIHHHQDISGLYLYMVINHLQKERMSCMRFIIFQAFAGCLNLTLCTDTWRCSMDSCCLFLCCLKCSLKSMFSVSSLFHAGACSQFEKHVSMFV